MKLSFTWPAYVIDSESDEESETEEIAPGDMNGFHVEANLSAYLDYELADLGVIGGVADVTVNKGRMELSISYWVRDGIEDKVKEKLLEDSRSQLSDGFGEGGIRYPDDSGYLLIIADTDEAGRVDCIDDGRVVPPPSTIAIAARKGDIVALQLALNDINQDINAKHQGYTGLHLAILSAHSKAAILLIRAGADTNVLDPMGSSPLHTCALANKLNDEAAAEIARHLLACRADRFHERDGETALSYAEMRKKTKLAAVLRS